jgi:hypothetical protein
MLIALIIIDAIVCAGFCAYISGQKNRNTTSWLLLGLLFGVFALIAIAATPGAPAAVDGASTRVPSFGASNIPGATCLTCVHCEFRMFHRRRCLVHNALVGPSDAACDSYGSTVPRSS